MRVGAAAQERESLGRGAVCGERPTWRRRGAKRVWPSGRRLVGAAIAGLCAVMLCAAPSLAQKASQGKTDAAPAPIRLEIDPISKDIAKNGLRRVEAELAKKRAPSPKEMFALAGVRFLRAMERASQQRYRYDSKEAPFAPILRLKLPKNPKPERFDSRMAERLFEQVIKDMAAVEAALDEIPEAALDDPTFAVTLSLDDLWIDANGNGKRDEAGGVSETVLDVAGDALGLNMRGMVGTVVRFDAADVSWLRAYALFLSGVSELALALDITSAIEGARPGWEVAAKHKPAPGLGIGEDVWIDQAATILLMLRGEVDAKRTRAALAHFDAMIANNRLFWAEVAEETDDLGEWIPNPSQKSALGGVTVSKETAAAWEKVLDEADKILKGELLLGHWRYDKNEKGEPIGVNLRKALEEPRSADVVLWLQGTAATPYLEKGEVAGAEAWSNFERLVSGQGLSFALWFN